MGLGRGVNQRKKTMLSLALLNCQNGQHLLMVTKIEPKVQMDIKIKQISQ